MRRTISPLPALVLIGAMALGCGYSEDEWQAQLSKYGKLDQAHKSQSKTLAEIQAELGGAKARVKLLVEQLEAMGVNLDETQAQLEVSGSENDILAANLAEVNRALVEYKARAVQLEKIKNRFEVLRDKLKKLTNLGLKVAIRHNRMVISLPGDVLFASGRDNLRAEGVQVLAAVAHVIRTDDQLAKRYFQIAGHTDSNALKGGRFKDNWGLSAMRAREVLVFMIAPLDGDTGGGGLSSERLHAAGYAATDSIASNDTKEGRQTNRRVELVLMPDVEEMLDLKGML